MCLNIYPKYLISTFILYLLVWNPLAFGEKRHLDSHEHGITELDISHDKDVIEMELRAPGADIVGFEREPETKTEIAAINGAIALLKKPHKLFTLTKESKCKATRMDASIARDHDDEHKSADHDDEHLEFKANYTFRCKNASAISQINFTNFKLIPNAQTIKIQLVSKKMVAVLKASPESPIIDVSGSF